ncbi:MAG: nucleotide sugar dehydrogenase [Planctomycetota bacterium]
MEPDAGGAQAARTGEAFEARRLRLARGEAVVGVVGLGAVGLSLATLLERAGYGLVLVDRDAERVARLRAGDVPLRFLGADVERALRSPRLRTITTESGSLAPCDAVLIAVPTPLGPLREPDLGPVCAAAEALAPHVAAGALVVLESTTWPGTTRELLGARLPHCYLAHSPERLDPGARAEDPFGYAVPKLVGGDGPAAQALALALYARTFATVVPVASPDVAEAAKLVENVYRAVNIALVNELKVAFEALGLDVWQVLDAAATKPFGFTRFDPGPGMGGHCIPIDPFYLAWAARRVGAETRFVELAGEINRAMPAFVVRRTAEALTARGGSLAGARVLLLGLAFKPDVDITEESPALALYTLYSAAGAEVRFSDPHVPRGPRTREVDLSHLTSTPLDDAALAWADVVVIATHHRAFDWDFVAARAALVVDTRNALRSRMGDDPRYVRA